MLICSLLAIQIINVVAQIYDESQFDQPQHIWHSYAFSTGAGNREELYYSNVELNKNFVSNNRVFAWKSLQIQEQVVIVGLCHDLLMVTTLNGENSSFTYNEEFQGTAKSLATFQQWDAKTQEIRSFLVVAIYTNSDHYILKWYQILSKKLRLLWDWPFYGNITHLDVIKIYHEPKLLIISHKGNIHKNSSAEIYSFNIIYEFDIWLFEKINLDGIPSSVVVFDNNYNIFFCASFPFIETTYIFKYSKSLCLDPSEKKHFIFHQKIFSFELKSIISFQAGFQWYLAIASKISRIYYIGENLLFQPISAFELPSFSNWLAIPIDTYRKDTLILADSTSELSLITLTEDEHVKVLGSFTEIVCGDDVHCLETIKKVALNQSTAFQYNFHQSIILSVKNGSPLFFKLHVKLRPLPDSVTLKIVDILYKKRFLEKKYTDQNEQIDRLTRKGMAQIKSANLSTESFEANQVSNIISQTKNYSQILSDANYLETKIELLNHDVKEFLTNLKSNISLRNEQDTGAFLEKNVTNGITFYGNVLIRELYLSTVNDYDVHELLEDSFRINKPKKIGGKKTLKNLNAENVIFEKIGDTLACEVVFSDDPWEEKKGNIINGDIVYEKKLSVLNQMTFLQGSPKRSILFPKTFREIPKHAYDTLNFEELEVTEDTNIQRTLNGQLLILPVRTSHLNVLNIVNQARVEVVNVKQNLNVSFINGKSFDSLFEYLPLKPSSQFEYSKVKVEGVFSAAALKTHHLNTIDISSPEFEFIDNKFNEKLFVSSPNAYTVKNKFERTENNLKRIVHVFQNLEVNGFLFSNKINNLNWVMLNDTVKRSEKFVAITGIKKFEKLTSKNTNLTGTLNGRYPEDLLTNLYFQTIRFPQVFDTVKFKNASLKNTWDGISVDLLNEFLVNLSSNSCEACNLTFRDNCFMYALNVTDLINDMSLKDRNLRMKYLQHKIDFRSIQADSIILQGSLVTNSNINNKNLTDFALLRVSLKSEEARKQDLFHHNITFSGDLNLVTLNFNDIASIINAQGDTKLIQKFLNGETYKIKKLLVKGNITTGLGINGFNISKISEKGFCITKPNSIKGNITFESTMNFDNINVTHSIDGFSLKKLEKDIAFKHSHVYLYGAKNFLTVRVMKNMKARTLNGHLVQELVTLEGDQAVKGSIHINGNVTVKGNITNYAAINNISVPALLRTFSTRFNSLIYSGNLNLRKSQITVRDLVIGGSVQNVSLQALVEDAVFKKECCHISGKKYFKGEVRFKRNVLTEGFMHGVNFSNFFTHIIFINKPARLEGTIIINESVLKVLKTTRHFNSTLINNFDTNDWLEYSIPIDSYDVVSGKKNFEDVHTLQDVSVDFINGHLPSAMISIKKKQYIPSPSLFPRIHTTSDLSVAGYVNGKNLIEEFQDTVLVNGDQTISGKTLFNYEFVVNGTLFVETVQEKPVSNLITLDTEQFIKTALDFKGSILAKKDVKNLKTINNIRLEDWNQNSVLLNQKQVLNGLWIVKGKVKTKNVDGEALMNEISLRNVSKNLQNGRLKAMEMKNATAVEYSDHYHKVEKLHQQFSNLPYLFHQFEIAEEIETTSVIESVITFKINNINHLIITFLNECLSTLYKWNKDDGAFDYMRRINIGSVNKWSVIYHNKATYLVTSSPTSSKSCEKNLQQGNIWVFSDDSDKYTHLLSTSAFVDITYEKDSSGEFYTIHEDGVLQLWALEETGNITTKFLLNLGPGNHKFIDFRIMGGLAVSNGRQIRKIILTEHKTIQSTISSVNAHLVALPVEGKFLVAMIVKDKIVIYENILEDKIFSVIHTYRAGSVLWFNFGSEKQAFLIVASHHKLIEVYEYKSVSGLVKVMSLQMFSSRLQSETFPAKEKYQSDKFLIVIQKKKLIFVRAEMLGDFVKNN